MKTLEQIKKEARKEFETNINEELGHISGVFMSQDVAGDIIMPTEELIEAKDRIMLYFSTALDKVSKAKDKEIEEMINSMKKETNPKNEDGSHKHESQLTDRWMARRVYNKALQDIIKTLKDKKDMPGFEGTIEALDKLSL